MKNIKAFDFSNIKDFVSVSASNVINYTGSTSEEVTKLYINNNNANGRKLPSDEDISIHQYFAAFDAFGLKMKEWKIVSEPIYIAVPSKVDLGVACVEYVTIGYCYVALEDF